MANYSEISMAYAGVCQAAKLVQELAHTGQVEQKEAFETLIKSLLVTSPESTLNVYGDGLANLKVGFETAMAQLSSGQGKLDTEIGRYWISLLALGRKLNQNSDAKTQLAQRLQQIKRQLSLYDDNVMADQMIANLAAIYSDIISPLGQKIHVFGLQDYLVRPDIQHKIRAVLLAGIRSAILWQQVGGTRWQFLFSRRKIFDHAREHFQSIY